MSSLEEEDPAAAIRALEEGIADRKRHILSHEIDMKRHREDLYTMHETLGMVRARHPELKP
jgi:hypothetical protein